MSEELIYQNDFASPRDWLVESNGTVEFAGGELRWDCEGKSVMGTIWCRERFSGPLAVEYDVKCLAGANNINFFLHADTPDGDLLETTDQRTGVYAEYQTFPNYIVTYLTDNEGRTRVRFRRDPGFELLDEAFSDAPIPQGQFITIRTIADADGDLVLCRDGEEVHRATDPQPLSPEGYLGLRTWNTSLAYRNFRVYALPG